MLNTANYITTHMTDPNNKFNLDKAKKSCKYCYGTGQVGTLPLRGHVRLVCRCVVQKTVEDEQIVKREQANTQVHA